MRRLTIRLAVALCTFALGFVAAVALRPALLRLDTNHVAVGELKEAPCPHVDDLTLDPHDDLSSSTALPILAYCELVNNPARYDGRVVRVRSRLALGIHGLLFLDRACSDWDKQTAVIFNEKDLDEIRRVLVEAGGPKHYRYEPLDLVAVGKFKRVTPTGESDSYVDTSPLHFEVLRVETASGAR